MADLHASSAFLLRRHHATGGGLLFYGTADGNFHGVDAATGKELWSQKLQYGADAPPITYTVNGKQYVALVAGGSDLRQHQGRRSARRRRVRVRTARLVRL